VALHAVPNRPPHRAESRGRTLEVAVVFVTRSREAVACNDLARAMFRRGDGFVLENGTVHATTTGGDAHLREAIGSALATQQPQFWAGTASATGSTREMIAVPLRPGMRLPAGPRSPDIAMLVLDSQRGKSTTVQGLTQRYGLTPREAALVLALLEGRTLKESAKELRMTYETARSHLRRIFYKTGTSRQADLVIKAGRLGEATDV
jgi:DNA-binding CsgD family transcriptional regulator